jgi:hypothetical protein
VPIWKRILRSWLWHPRHQEIRIAYAASESTGSIKFNRILQFLRRLKTEVCLEKSGDIPMTLSSVGRRNFQIWGHSSDLVEKMTAICFWLDQ